MYFISDWKYVMDFFLQGGPDQMATFEMAAIPSIFKILTENKRQILAKDE